MLVFPCACKAPLSNEQYVLIRYVTLLSATRACFDRNFLPSQLRCAVENLRQTLRRSKIDAATLSPLEKELSWLMMPAEYVTSRLHLACSGHRPRADPTAETGDRFALECMPAAKSQRRGTSRCSLWPPLPSTLISHAPLIPQSSILVAPRKATRDSGRMHGKFRTKFQ